MLQIGEHTAIGTFEGKPIQRVTILSSRTGFTVSLINLGATLTSVKVPDRHGILAEVTLGHDCPEGYSRSPAYFGATIGRVANRIAGAEFTLDGQRYRLAKNDQGLHCLHGGPRGFHRVVWDLNELEILDDEIAVPFTYLSPHMEEGFPGTLSVSVTYRVREGSIGIDYHAVPDRPTLVNLTNHAYWNLDGLDSADDRSALAQVMCICADAYLPVDKTLVPTGQIAPVAGTPLDLRRSRPVRDALSSFGDIDHCFVLTGTGLRPVAELHSPHTGRVMTLETDQAGLQFYTGNFLGGVPYRSGVAAKYQALCLEAQGLPDAIHHPSFPSIVMTPGETYRQTTTYSFGLR